MRKISALLVSAGVLLLAACQSVMPINTAPVDDTAQTTVAASTSATNELVSEGSGQPGPVHCLIDFEATVRQGPSSGVALRGLFDFVVDGTGTLSGNLRQANASEIPVAGQVTGRAINLVFELSTEQLIFGVGTAKEMLTSDTCGLVLGGPFVGPASGDTGDWLARRVGNPSSVVPDEPRGDPAE